MFYFCYSAWWAMNRACVDWCKPVCVQCCTGFEQLPDFGVEERWGGTDFALSGYRQLIRAASRSEAGNSGNWSLRRLLLCSPSRGVLLHYFYCLFFNSPRAPRALWGCFSLVFPLGTTFPRVPTLKGLKCWTVLTCLWWGREGTGNAGSKAALN